MSPFMTGLLLGMTVFSALSLQWAKAELAELQARKAQQDRAQAQELANALEFAVLTEDASGYSDDYALQRARAFANVGSQTRGGNTVLATTRADEPDETAPGVFGVGKTQVALTAGDDRFARAAAGRVESAAALQQQVGQGGPTVLANLQAVRERQVLTSTKRMDALAEQVFAYYAATMRFPDEAAFATLQGRLNLRDAWGQRFGYSVTPDGQSATLSFTTPWDYTRELPLSLKN